MPELGRYLLNDPSSARTQAFGNLREKINMIGNLKLQQILGKKEREAKLEDDISLINAKTQAEMNSPLGQLDMQTKLSTLNKNRWDMGEDPIKYPGTSAPAIPAPAAASPSETPNISLLSKPVFNAPGDMIVSGSTSENTPAGLRQKSVTFMNPEEKILEKSISENVPAINKADTVDSLLQNVEQSWMTTVPKEKGGMGMLPAGPIDWLGSKAQGTQEQSDTKSYMDFLGGIRALLARGFGDVGNLSEYEQKAVLSAVPQIAPFQDTLQTGQTKLNRLRKTINDIKAARQRNLYLDGTPVNQNGQNGSPVFGGQKKTSSQGTAPQGASYYSPSTGKYYTEDGQEL